MPHKNPPRYQVCYVLDEGRDCRALPGDVRFDAPALAQAELRALHRGKPFIRYGILDTFYVPPRLVATV